MPEKITKQEAKIEQTIRAVRKAKELLQEEGRNTLPYDADEAKEMKIKTPKAVKADKITNETQPKEGYGLAGEENVGKAISNDGVERLNTKIRELMQKVHAMDNPTKEDLTNIHHELEKLKRIITQYDKMESFVG